MDEGGRAPLWPTLALSLSLEHELDEDMETILAMCVLMVRWWCLRKRHSLITRKTLYRTQSLKDFLYKSRSVASFLKIWPSFCKGLVDKIKVLHSLVEKGSNVRHISPGLHLSLH